MEPLIINGQKIAEELRADIAQKVVNYKNVLNIIPGIAVVLVGEDPASQIYVSMKEKAAAAAGMHSAIYRLPADVSEGELLKLITTLNNDQNIHGILVQLPLPQHIKELTVLMAIDPRKDVDGFHPINVGLLQIGQDTFVSCTPLGVMKMLEYHNISPLGKHAVIVGRSNIVGKPMGALLLAANATVTTCHSKTTNIKDICRQADILVAAVGRPKMIDSSYVKEGAVVIDVGINRVGGKLYGDVDYDSVLPKVSAITPVPKGVGPMTIAMLMSNTLKSFEKFNAL